MQFANLQLEKQVYKDGSFHFVPPVVHWPGNRAAEQIGRGKGEIEIAQAKGEEARFEAAMGNRRERKGRSAESGSERVKDETWIKWAKKAGVRSSPQGCAVSVFTFVGSVGASDSWSASHLNFDFLRFCVLPLCCRKRPLEG